MEFTQGESPGILKLQGVLLSSIGPGSRSTRQAQGPQKGQLLLPLSKLCICVRDVVVKYLFNIEVIQSVNHENLQ